MPTDIFTAIAADDETVYRSGVTYPPAGAVTRAATDTELYGQRDFYAGPTYYISCGLVRFDTSTLPDNILVSNAWLHVTRIDLFNTNGRSLTADWYLRAGTDADHSAIALTTALTAYSHDSAPPASASADILLTAADANISRTSYTGLRLHASGGVPTGPNYIGWASADNGTQPGPKLVVAYTVLDTTPPASPTGLTATVLGG